MEYNTPNLKREMLKDYTVLVPNMSPIQFRIGRAALQSEGYEKVELCGSRSPEALRLGLKYVHNDTCYPAILIIGQFLEALESGKYDPDHTALIISQSGGGCRASNYIKLLQKALVNAGYSQVPVGSANVSGLEKSNLIPWTPRMLVKLCAAVFYGDLLMALRNEVHAYEVHAGDTEKKLELWIERISNWMHENRNVSLFSFRKVFPMIVKDFAEIEIRRVPKVKVGVVGEIYVKFSPYGNNELLSFLEAQGCEVNFPGVLGYLAYCSANMKLDTKYYGMKPIAGRVAGLVLNYFDMAQKEMAKVLTQYGFYSAGSFEELMKKPEGILDLGTKMGEGWLLTAEMVELIEGGYPNIICAQPFGCLPNHIAGKGVVNKLRERFPQANISPIDYDPSAAKVNQENRIRLMLAVAREQLETRESDH